MAELKIIPYNPSNRRRDWSAATDGEWWIARSEPEGTLTSDQQENNIIRTAARQWAKNHGWQYEARIERGGKEIHIRFYRGRRPTKKRVGS